MPRGGVDGQSNGERTKAKTNLLSLCDRKRCEKGACAFATRDIGVYSKGKEKEMGFENDDEYQEYLDSLMDVDDFEIDFQDPGGNSALRRATHDNPRNLPCPTCGKPNRLTPADRALGYQCDECADAQE
jgi:hypothetical protein